MPKSLRKSKYTSWSSLLRGLGTFLTVTIFVAGVTAHANLLTNGSFEMPVIPVGGIESVTVGSNGIPGWSVVGPSGLEVAIVNGAFTLPGYTFPAQEGSQFIDLTGVNSNNFEGVSQTVTTVPGATYTLTFWIGNVSGGVFGVYSSAALKINGAFVGNFTNSTPGTTLVWQQFTYSFIAARSSTTIEFDNLDPPTDNANALDNVDLEEGGAAAPLPTNLLVNGDFETPAGADGNLVNYSTGTTQIPGWSVIGTAPLTVDIPSGALVQRGFYFPPENGLQWLDLTGTDYSTGTRGITQTVATTPGANYELSFWVGNVYDTANPSSFPDGQNFGTSSSVRVEINGASAGTFTNNAPSTVMNWQQFSLTFVASGSSTTIEFDNQDPPTDTLNGLDHVILQEITGPIPTVSGLVSAGAFGAFTSVAPGSWVEIYGSDFANSTQGWTSAEFDGNNAPNSLAGTSVSIGGEAAFVDYISPGQVNALIPSDVSTGIQSVTVTTPSTTSIAYNVNVNATEPGLLAPSSFNLGGIQYAVALFSDGAYVLPTGAISGVTTAPAKPGDTIILYGVGFGPVKPDIPAGQIVQQANTLADKFELSIGGLRATVNYAGLSPGSVGLYQFNIVVPNVAASGAVPLTFTLDGTSGAQVLHISVQN
jgi:uncharacterized protein (TIGR03437 family)